MTHNLYDFQEDSYEHEDKLIGLLNTIFSTKKSFAEIENSMERVYNIPMKNNLGEEVRQMCNLSEGIEQKGIQKGIEKGIQQTVLKALELNPAEKVAEFLQMPLEQVLKIAKTK